MRSSSSEEVDFDWVFYAVLVGVIANGSKPTWGEIYDEAKTGASVIAELMIDDLLQAELKDLHGRSE